MDPKPLPTSTPDSSPVRSPYAEEELEGAIRQIHEAPTAVKARMQLSFNATLVGGLVASGELPREETEHRLLQAAVENGMPSEDGEAIITKQFDKATEHPRHAGQNQPMTDAGNARRLAVRCGRKIRFCPALGGWLIYDGTRWLRDDIRQIFELAKATARGIEFETGSLRPQDCAPFARKSESLRSLSAMIELARSEPGIPAIERDFDTDTNLLNLDNGTIDLRTRKLRPHRAEDMLTKIVHISYNPDAVSPIFDAFLDTVMGGDGELIEFLAQAVGYSLTGSTEEQCFFILHGEGANGKSVFLDVLKVVTGDYGKTLPADALLEGGKNVDVALAQLPGVRLVVASETRKGRQLNEPLLKQLSAGDRMTGKALYQAPFEFDPQAKIWLATNHLPEVSGTDEGLWRRMREIPFDVKIPEEEQDKRLMKDKLTTELSGILNWALQGHKAWQVQGLRVPSRVRESTADHRNGMDLFGRFLRDNCLEIERGEYASSTDLHQRLRSWLEEQGEPKMSQKAMAEELKHKGYRGETPFKDRRTYYGGLRLLSYDEMANGIREAVKPCEAFPSLLPLKEEKTTETIEKKASNPFIPSPNRSSPVQSPQDERLWSLTDGSGHPPDEWSADGSSDRIRADASTIRRPTDLDEVLKGPVAQVASRPMELRSDAMPDARHTSPSIAIGAC